QDALAVSGRRRQPPQHHGSQDRGRRVGGELGDQVRGERELTRSRIVRDDPVPGLVLLRPGALLLVGRLVVPRAIPGKTYSARSFSAPRNSPRTAGSCAGGIERTPASPMGRAMCETAPQTNSTMPPRRPPTTAFFMGPPSRRRQGRRAESSPPRPHSGRAPERAPVRGAAPRARARGRPPCRR